jgi:drug/metabolite transporter (DMT)-like permease
VRPACSDGASAALDQGTGDAAVMSSTVETADEVAADPPRWLVVGGLAVGVVSVSFAAILIRWADAPALSVSFWRCLGAAVALLPFAVRQRRHLARLARRDRWLLLLSALSLALHFSLWIGSLSYTTVASSVTLVCASTPFVGLAAARFLDEPPTRRTWIGMGLTLAGAIGIGAADLGSADLGARALLGDAMALGGAVAITGYLIVGRKLRRQGLPNSVYGTTVYGAAALVLGPVCLLTGADLVGFDPQTWWALAAIVAVPQLLGHTVFNALMGTVTATVVAIVVLAEPMVSTALAWALLDELPSPMFWLGAPFILLGVYVAATGEAAAGREPPNPADPEL